MSVWNANTLPVLVESLLVEVSLLAIKINKHFKTHAIRVNWVILFLLKLMHSYEHLIESTLKNLLLLVRSSKNNNCTACDRINAH